MLLAFMKQRSNSLRWNVSPRGFQTTNTPDDNLLFKFHEFLLHRFTVIKGLFHNKLMDTPDSIDYREDIEREDRGSRGSEGEEGRNSSEIGSPPPQPPPVSIPIQELMKWRGLNYLEKQYLKDIRLAYVYNETAFLITKDDEFYSVGKNEFGCLGTGSDTPFFTKVPTRVSLMDGKGVKDIVVGLQHRRSETSADRAECLSVFALTQEGDIYSWGYNGHGVLASSSRSVVRPPEKVIFPEANEVVKVVQIAAGEGFVLALSQEGEVWGWGINNKGQVGHDFKLDLTPVKVNIFHQKRHHHHEPKDIEMVAVSCGETHSVALSKKGRVYTWGGNDKGQLGDGSKDDHRRVPQRIKFPSKTDKITKISCGRNHTLALSESGRLFCWGTNHYGQLGIGGDKHKSRTPLEVQSIKEPVIDVMASSNRSVSACVTHEATYMWGKCPEVMGKVVDIPWTTLFSSLTDVFSSFCVPPVTPLPLTPYLSDHNEVDPELMKWNALKLINPSLLRNIKTAFVCGSGFEQTSILVTNTDEVFFVGRNVHGSLGTGCATEFETKEPLLNKTLSFKGVYDFSFGLDVEGGCMCLFTLTKEGHVYSFGYNDYGELGLGDVSLDPVSPQRVHGILDSIKVAKITCGSDHTLAISADGLLFSWGYNMYGQLGTGNLTDRGPSPEQVKLAPEFAKVESAAAGMFHSACLTKDGVVYIWGQNDQNFKQLGGATKQDYSAIPLLLKSSEPISNLCCGDYFTLMITESGRLLFFGACKNSGIQYSKPHPLHMPLDDPVTDLGASHWSSIAACQTRSGKVYLWGKLKGGKVRPMSTEESCASTVDDVFAMFGNPPGMIRALNVRID